MGVKTFAARLCAAAIISSAAFNAVVPAVSATTDPVATPTAAPAPEPDPTPAPTNPPTTPPAPTTTDEPSTTSTATSTTSTTQPSEGEPSTSTSDSEDPTESTDSTSTTSTTVEAEMLPDDGTVRAITFPVAGPVSYGNGWNDCRDECSRRHQGTDVLGTRLQPILAMQSGVVDHLVSGHETAGEGVVIRDGEGWTYRVYHLNNDSPGTDDGSSSTWTFAEGIGPGSSVRAGQLIGFMGDSGNSEYSVPHAHVEIHRPDGTPINPYWSLQRAQRDVTCAAGDGVPVPGSDTSLGLDGWGGQVPEGYRTLSLGYGGAMYISTSDFIPVDATALRAGDPSLAGDCSGRDAAVDLTLTCHSALLPVSPDDIRVVSTNQYATTETGRAVAGVPTGSAPVDCALIEDPTASMDAARLDEAAVQDVVFLTPAGFNPRTDFNIEGNYDGINDWAVPYGPGFTPAPQSYPTTGITQRTTAGDRCDGTDNTSMTGKLDAQPWATSSGGPNKKADLCSSGAALEVVNVNGQYNYILYQYWSRAPTATGDVTIYIHLEGPVAGRGDDRLIKFDYSPSRGIVVSTLSWNGSTWIDGGPLVTGSFAAANGPNTSAATGGTGSANAATFGEMVVNLTAAGIMPENACRTFSASTVITQTGNSQNAKLQDRIVLPDPLEIENCADVRITKVTEPANTAGGPFGYLLNQADRKPVSGPETVNDGGIGDDKATNSITGQLTVPTDTVDVWTNVIASPGYQLTEPVVPTNWQTKTIACTFYDPFTGATVTRTISGATPPLDRFQIPSRTLSNGVTTSCVITNATSTVTVAKTGAGSTTDAFTFGMTGKPDQTLTLGQTGTPQPYAPGVPVTITETLPNTQPGWVVVGYTCTNTNTGAIVATSASDSTPATAEVTTVSGANITCTFTNQQQARIRVTKDVVPNATTPTFRFTWSGTPGATTNNLADNQSSAYYTVNPNVGTVTGAPAGGNYVVTEGTVAGYTLAGVTCTDPTGDTVGAVAARTATYRVSPGETVDCTFRNEKSGTVTITKNAVPDGPQDFAFTTTGGPSLASPFSLDDDTDGALPNSRTFTDVAPGSYTVTEALTAGWDLTGLTCTETITTGQSTTSIGTRAATIVVDPGDVVNCTFTNTRRSAPLTLTKAWTNAVTGNAVSLTVSDNAQPGTATGSSTATSPTAATTTPAVRTVYAGSTVTLSEAFTTGLPANYTTTLTCVSGTTTTTIPLNGLTGTFTVPDTPVATTCTFTNAAKTATVVLTKNWGSSPTNAGESVALTATSPLGTGTGSNTNNATADDTTATVLVSAGTSVTLTEALGAGLNPDWYATSLQCANASGTLVYTLDALTGSLPITAADAGATITCTFINQRNSASVVLVKAWDQGRAGDSATLTLTGLSTATGTGVSTVGTNPTFTDTATQRTLRVWAGETISFGETLSAPTIYATTITCRNAGGTVVSTVTGTSGTYTVPASPVALTCTVANVRQTATVVVQKTWVDAVAGDTAALSVTDVQTAANGTATSTATGTLGSVTDSTNRATVTVLAGGQVRIDETVNPAARYVTGAPVCTAAGAPVTVAADASTSAPNDYTFPAPSTPGATVTCTYTNRAPRGTITIVKNTVGADGTFDFSQTWPPRAGETAGSFSLTTSGGTASSTWPNVLAGTYQVTELVGAGQFDFTSLTCLDPSNGSSVAGLTGTIDLDDGETVVCTYTNTQRASLIVTKDAQPDDDQDFTFATTTTGSIAVPPAIGSFILDDDTDATRPNTTGSVLIAANQGYTLTEAPTTGWTIAPGSQCITTDAAGVTVTLPVDTTTGAVSFTPRPGATVSCTYVNQAAPASLTITKTAAGVPTDYPWSFEFTLTPASVASPNPIVIAGTGSTSQSATVNDLVLNQTYTLAETAPAGWTPGPTTCTGLTDLDPAAAGFQFQVTSPAQTLSCAITNTVVPGSITIVKNADPAGPQEFEFTTTRPEGSTMPDGMDSFQLVDDGSADMSDIAAFPNIQPGSYTVTEASVDGWDLTGLSCTDASAGIAGPAATITLDPGENVTCTFTNTRRATTLTLTKTWQDAIVGNAVELSISDDALGGTSTGTSTVVTPASGDTDDATRTVYAGSTVTLAEAFTTGDAANYTTTLTCTDATGLTYTAGSLTGTYTVPTTPTPVTCTFANAAKTATVELTKNWGTSPTNAGESVTLTATSPLATSTGPNTNNAIADDTTPSVRAAAGTTVDLAEVFGAGLDPAWYTTTLQCANASGTLNDTQDALTGSLPITAADAGQTITCTFVNQRNSAQMTLVKQWDNGKVGDSAQLSLTGLATATGPATPAGSSVVTAATTSAVDAASTLTLRVWAGETVSFGETLGATNGGVYTSSIDCPGISNETIAADGRSGTAVIAATPADFACTVLNTRNTVTVAVQKTWEDAVLGDTAELTVADAETGATDSATSTVTEPSFTDTTNVASTTVLTGGLVIIDEAVDSTATTYLTGLPECTYTAADNTTVTLPVTPLLATASAMDYSFTAPPAAVGEVTCEYTNRAPRGTITIVKNTVGADGTFAFTQDWDEPAAFSLVTSANTASEVWNDVLAGSYTVSETDPTPLGFDLTSLTCTDPSNESPTDGLTATIDLDDGEAVTCTFVNTQRATVTVVKDAVPDDDQEFSFTTTSPVAGAVPTALAGFSLVDDADDDGSQTIEAAVPANTAYTITEGATPGWTVSAASACVVTTITGPVSVPVNLATGGVTFTPLPGATVECTFVNEAAPASLTITKTAAGVPTDYPWSFSFELTPPSATSPNPIVISGTGTTPASVTVGDLVLNQTYTLTETASSGWTAGAITCTGLTDLDAAAAGFQFQVTAPAQALSCSVTNTVIPGTVTVVKDAEPNGPQDFTFTTTRPDGSTVPDGMDSFLLDDDADATLANTAEFTEAQPGTYTITEDPTAGWDLTELECTGDFVVTGAAVEFTLDPDEDVTCTFTNTRRSAELTLTKTWFNAVADDAVSLTITDDALTGESTGTSVAGGATEAATRTVYAGSTVTLSEAFTTGDAGNYTTTLTCVSGGVSTTVTLTALSGTYTVPESPEATTCTFANAARTATVVLTKAWGSSPTNAGDSVTLAAESPLGSGTGSNTNNGDATDDVDATVLAAAGTSVDLTEVFGAGFDPAWYTTSLSCADASGTLVYTADALTGSLPITAADEGETITCTFTNQRDSASMTLVKEWVDGHVGDSAQLSLTGLATATGPATPPGSSTVTDSTVSALDPASTLTMTVWAGETVSMSETLGDTNAGSYASTIDCPTIDNEVIAPDGRSGTFVVASAPSDLACTVTNARTTSTVSVLKTWQDAVLDDTALLTVTDVETESSQNATSTVTDPSFTDEDNVASVTVLSGGEVIIDEAVTSSATTYVSSPPVCSYLNGAVVVPVTVTAVTATASPLDYSFTAPTLASAEVTCEYVNRAPRGSITIVKNTVGADGTFQFTQDWATPEPFELTTTGNTAESEWTGVLAGTYTVSELDPAATGFDLTSLSCSDGATVNGPTASIELVDGGDVTCTFVNTQRATVRVIKDAVPDDDQDFSFATTSPVTGAVPADLAAFVLDDDGDDTEVNTVEAAVPSNTEYMVTEAATDGWTLSAASACVTDAAAPVTTTVDPATGAVTITPLPGETVTCTFVNEANPSSLTISKTAVGVPDSYGWEFEFDLTPRSAADPNPLTISGTGPATGTLTVDDLVLNQTYTLTERPIVGWTNGPIECAGLDDSDPGTAGFQFVVTEPELELSCTVVNTLDPGELVLDKSAQLDSTNGDRFGQAGETITWQFLVYNASVVPVANLVIDDELLEGLGVTISCDATTLAPAGEAGDWTTCRSTAYTLTAADIATLVWFENVAVAEGTLPPGPGGGEPPPVTSNEDDAEVPLAQIALVKSAALTVDPNGDGYGQSGDQITWTFTVTNLGAAPMSGVEIDDPLLEAMGLDISCPTTDLTAAGTDGDTVVCTSEPYTLTTDDVTENATIHNIATAVGFPTNCELDIQRAAGGVLAALAPACAVETPPSEAEIPLGDLILEKSAELDDVNNDGYGNMGETIHWEFTVTNPGQTTLEDITINDEMLTGMGLTVTCDPTTLPSGASTTCISTTHTITADDVATGSFVNVATATGTPPGGPPITSPPAEAETPLLPPASMTLIKRANLVDTNGDGAGNVGEQITWSFEITNTGQVALEGITVDDPTVTALGVTITCPSTTLAPGNTMTCTSSAYTITAANVAAGRILNVATARGSYPPPTCPDCDPPDVVTPPSETETPLRPIDPPPTTLPPTTTLPLTLPKTGSESMPISVVALFLMLGGLALTGATRRLSRRRTA